MPQQPPKESQQKTERPTYTKIFREFKGINTKNDRTAIPPETFFDLVNLMPIGSANLHSIPSPSASLASFSATMYRFQYANINSTDYLICFGSDGSVVAYNINANTTTTIAAAATLSGSGSKMDQWKNQAILIVDTNGYFSWNGTTWTQITGGILPGTYVNPDIAVFNGYVWIVSNRFLYVSNPNQYGQSAGTPLSTTANFLSGSTTINVVDPTTLQSALGNVVVGSTVTGAGIPAGTTVSTIDYTTGVITLNNATTAKAPTETAATTASFNAGDGQMTVGSATGIKIGSLIYSTAAGAGLPAGVAVSPGYVVGNTFVPMTITATANHVAGSVYYFTYPVTLTFSTSDSGWDLSGGSVVQYLTDPQYRGQVTRLLSANGYLYLFSKSSIFVISDVYVPSGSASPVFSIVNVQALIGSDQQMSVFALDRKLYFANPYGLWALQGVTAERISEQIDGTIQYLDPSFAISGGTTQVWNIAQATFLIKQLNDPVFGTRVVLACFFDKNWWFYQPPTNCTFVGSGMAGTNTNVPSLFALINNRLYRLFADYTNSPAASWKTAMWAMDDALSDKEVFRTGFEVTSATGVGASFTLTLDTPNQSTALTPKASSSSVLWVNNSLSTVGWANNSSVTIVWYNGTYLLYFGDGYGGYAKYVGMTGTATAAPPYAISSNAMDYTLRKRW